MQRCSREQKLPILHRSNNLYAEFSLHVGSIFRKAILHSQERFAPKKDRIFEQKAILNTEVTKRTAI